MRDVVSDTATFLLECPSPERLTSQFSLERPLKGSTEVRIACPHCGKTVRIVVWSPATAVRRNLFSALGWSFVVLMFWLFVFWLPETHPFDFSGFESSVDAITCIFLLIGSVIAVVPVFFFLAFTAKCKDRKSLPVKTRIDE